MWLRYVVLRHETPAGYPRPTHWDFLLELPSDNSSGLHCWALASEPDSAGTIAAVRLADHRRAYLDYEGPVSGGRGEVTRWDAGVYQRLEPIASEPAAACRLALRGQRLVGEVTLTRLDGDAWRFDYRTTRTTGDDLSAGGR